jgi:hypothetical protein
MRTAYEPMEFTRSAQNPAIRRREADGEVLRRRIAKTVPTTATNRSAMSCGNGPRRNSTTVRLMFGSLSYARSGCSIRVPGLCPWRRRQTPVSTIDPKRSDDSPLSCRSRVMERTLTAPPGDPDRLSSTGNPARPNLATSAKLPPTEAMRNLPRGESCR